VSLYFPRNTRELEAIEPPGFKRLTLSLVEMAVITGVVLRLLRAVTLGAADYTGWLYVAGVFLLAATILFGMAALHLANFTPRQWLWRAPLFAAVEAGTEMIMSAALISAGREPVGSALARMDQWPAMALQTLGGSMLAVCVFAAALAGVVHLMRNAAIARAGGGRAAARLRAELLSDAAEPDIDRSRAS
jgi:hypothetical protein